MQARFGFDITPTQPTGPCCETSTTASTTASTTTTATTTTASTTTAAAGTCTCGLEGTTRIVGGQQSTVIPVFLMAVLYPESYFRQENTRGSWP